ncbi:MAG: serine hydrolase domain-containing protein [Bacteroidota bacterium]
MKNAIAFTLFLCLFTLNITSCEKEDDTPQPQTDITTVEELTAALNDIYATSDAPGFAISVVKNDVLLYQEAFGQADLGGNKAYTNQTVQPIGSISKTFVAAAVVKAIEQGYFTLETNINDILPFEVKNPKKADAMIQVKHLVTHTSGLLDDQETYIQSYHILPGEDLNTDGSNLLQQGFGTQQRTTIPLENYLSSYYKEGGALYDSENFSSRAPGESWSYSNIATSLAAFLVEEATGTSFKEYVLTNILQALNMTNTSYDIEAFNSGSLATLYWDRATPLPKYFNDSYPDGSVMTSNEDLAKYLMDMIKGANGQSTILFSKESYDLLFNALLPEGLIPVSLADSQGIFWFLKDGTIKHDGSDPGTTCNMEFDKDKNAGYLLMTNMDATIDEHETAYFELATKVHNAISAFIDAN